MSSVERRNRAKLHASRRAKERWDVAIDVEEIGALNAVIRSGLGRLLKRNRKKKNGRAFWVTTLGMDRIPVIYDFRLNTIVTVLPADCPAVLRDVHYPFDPENAPINSEVTK